MKIETLVIVERYADGGTLQMVSQDGRCFGYSESGYLDMDDWPNQFLAKVEYIEDTDFNIVTGIEVIQPV